MKILFSLSLCLLFVHCSRAQYSLDMQVHGMQTSKAFLLEFVGAEAANLIDSTQVDQEGRIHFTLGQHAHTGMYRVVLGRQTWLDVVFNHEDIRLETHFQTPVDSLRVHASRENQLWRDYMNTHLVISRKQEHLYRLQNLYDPSDPFYAAIQREIAGLSQLNPDDAARKIILQAPDSYVARFLSAELSPDIPVGLSREEELNWLMEHFFDQIDFQDTTLMYSPPLMSRVNTYFGIVRQAFPPDEVEENLIRGLNRLLSLAAVHDTMYAFLLDQLSHLFEQSEYDMVFAYLTENFLLDGACADEERSRELEEILADIKKTEPGKQAPELILPASDGTVILSEMTGSFKLIVFWASWCPHCNDMLPVIHSFYKQYQERGLDVLAISLDTDRQAYEQAIRAGGYEWVNYSDLKGWDSPLALDYGIRATPTLILVGPDGKILAKPANPRSLNTWLKRLFP